MKLYNTATRKVEEIVPITQNKIGIYSCGPTVYWNQHIGHMYAYVQWDVLVRFLRYSGYDVKHVMNITDVGHLVSDGDEGEDKMEKGAKREGLTVWEVAKKYEQQFIESLELLNINKPSVICRATEHIPEQIALNQKIEKNGFAYSTKTGLVFDTGKFNGYAAFANLKLEEMESGARVEVDEEKKHPWDFLLWVTNQPNHIMKWPSPWGEGFPGWHIECTAMSVKYLGEEFEIHTGGIEHIGVHHTNEIAQGFGAFGHQTARYWVHNAWLTIDGVKMSKSIGNVVLVTDIKERGYDPLALRYLILTSSYRKGLDFTWKSLDSAAVALGKIKRMVLDFKAKGGVLTEIDNTYVAEFKSKLSNDLAIPEAIAVLWRLLHSDLPEATKIGTLYEFDKVLGFGLQELAPILTEIPLEIGLLIQKRDEARKAKNWSESDKLREELENAGFSVEDTAGGTKIKKVLK